MYTPVHLRNTAIHHIRRSPRAIIHALATCALLAGAYALGSVASGSAGGSTGCNSDEQRGEKSVGELVVLYIVRCAPLEPALCRPMKPPMIQGVPACRPSTSRGIPLATDELSSSSELGASAASIGLADVA